MVYGPKFNAFLQQKETVNNATAHA